MKQRISVDLYTKVVLTVIALSLVWLCLTDARSVAPLGAQAPEIVDVRIRAIDRQPAAQWDAVRVEANASAAHRSPEPAVHSGGRHERDGPRQYQAGGRQRKPEAARQTIAG